ncbi:MAG: PAS domain S-box protein, partial [Candidatus Nealsonbacteria bacterium]|nr:PAS domain S-box protein [Candidatus Nealsonbacteria bacterium]
MRIEELRGSIVHLDEVLTMSARMAAFTGDLEWENRYRRFEPQLDAAIKEAMTLAPEAYGGEAAAESAAANIKLVDMENRTFDLVRQGHADQAKAVLFSDEYEKQKQVYAQGMTRFAKPKERYLRLTELRGTIVHLDEVLRKSARSAAATGDPRWEERYRRFEPQLDAAIKEAIALASGAHSGEAAAETDAANIKLVEIENHAFDLVRQGRAEEAKAVLFGDEYESQKRIYAEGMNEFATGLADAVSASLKREQRLSSLLVGAECLLMPFLIVAWLVVFRAVRNWKTTLAKQAEELVEVNESLDQKVAERTEALRNEVTERKQVEQSLRRSEAKHRVLFESSRDAIMTLAPPSWKFTSGNPATVEMFGARDETEFVSLGPRELSPEFQPDGRPSSEKAREMIETAMKEGASFFEWQHKRLHGQEFPATVLITRVELGDQVFLQATVRDISEQKRANEALQEAKDYTDSILSSM